MEANFSKNIKNANFSGLGNLIKRGKPDNSPNQQTKEVERSAQEMMNSQGRAFVEMCKTSQNREITEIRKLTDKEFEQKKEYVQEKIEGLPDNLKEKFNDVRLNKMNIFVAEKLLRIPWIFENFSSLDILCFFNNIDSLDNADSKCKMTDIILEKFGSNTNVAENMYFILNSIQSKDDYDIKCQMIDKITEMLNNKKLKKCPDLKDHIGEIICSTRTQDNFDIRCKMADKILNDKAFYNNSSIISNFGKIISYVTSQERFEFMNKVLDEKSVILRHKELMENAAQIAGSIYCKSAIPIAERIVKTPSLMNSGRDEIKKISQIIISVGSENSAKVANKILDLFKDYLENVSIGALRDLIRNVYYGGDPETLCQIIDLSKSIKDDPDKIGELFSIIDTDSLKSAREIMMNNNLTDQMKIDFLILSNKYGSERMAKVYKNNAGKIKELFENGYRYSVQNLQNSSDINIIFKKENNEEQQQVRLNEKGIISESKCQMFYFDNNEYLKRTSTSDGKYSCDSYYDYQTGDLKKKIRVINGKNGPLYVQKTVASPIMEGVFDTTVYNLAQMDKNIDEVLKAIKNEGTNKSTEILEEIEKAGIKGWNFSKTFENPNGEKTHIEKFQRGDLHTQRKYTSNYDGTKTALDYTISDTHGKKLLNIHRTFELDGNVSISTLNGKEYLAEFDDNNMTVKIGDTIIDFKEKMKDEIPYNQEKLWHQIKETPADLILNFAGINKLSYTERAHMDFSNNALASDHEGLRSISHELGHYLDATEGGSKPMAENDYNPFPSDDISHNEDLLKIYNEEIEDFKKSVSEEEQKNIEYFSQISESPALGLGELIAETNMLCTTQNRGLTRASQLYLTRYFPKTTAKAAELLGYTIA